MKTVKVLIRKMDTGEDRWFQPPDYPDDFADHTILYQWMDGNYSCDCNRSAFFARVGGDPEPEVDCNTCDESRKYRVPYILIDGEKVLIDDYEGGGNG